MLKYSLAAGNLILEDLKKWNKRLKIIFALFTLVYLVCCIIMEIGMPYINIPLLALFAIYTIFKLITYKRNNVKAEKAITKTYKLATLALKTFTLASTLYGIYIATISINGISIILATLSIIIWVLQVLLEILIAFAEPKIRLLIAGIMEDFKPIVNAHNLLHTKENDWLFDYNSYKKEYCKLDEKIKNDQSVKKMAKKKVKISVLSANAKK